MKINFGFHLLLLVQELVNVIFYKTILRFSLRGLPNINEIELFGAEGLGCGAPFVASIVTMSLL